MKTTNPVKLLILWMAMPLLARVERASGSGIVSDKTGAAVPAAQVSAENLATGVKSATVSNASGNYYLNLLAGDYKVTVTHEGFGASVLPKLTLSVAQAATVNVPMDVSAVQQQVTVSDVAPLIDQETA